MELAVGASSAIQAIPTRYNGCTYRSRLEARWARLFDELKIEFWYEPAGFKFKSGLLYLPDFYLPIVKLWAEVKPDLLNETELLKAESLALESGRDVLLLIGPPDLKLYPCIFVGDGFPLRGDALLDIDFHGRKYYDQQHRLFIDHGGEWPAAIFSEQYRHAVFTARTERFQGAA